MYLPLKTDVRADKINRARSIANIEWMTSAAAIMAKVIVMSSASPIFLKVMPYPTIFFIFAKLANPKILKSNQQLHPL